MENHRECPDLENAIVQAAARESGRQDLSIRNVLNLEQFRSAISIEKKLGFLNGEKSKFPNGRDEEYVNNTDNLQNIERRTRHALQQIVKLPPHTKVVIKKFKETESRRVVVKVCSNYTFSFAYLEDAPDGFVTGGAALGATVGAVMAGPIGAAAGAATGYLVAKRMMKPVVQRQVSARDVFALLPGYREKGNYVTCEVQMCIIRYSEKEEYERIPPQH